MRAADKEIRELQREEDKFIKEVKKVAALGTRGGTAVKSLAKNVVMARKAKERACTTRAQLNSVGMTLSHQVASIKMSKCMAQSADVMKAMNAVVKLPQLNASMMEMAREMEKAGLIEELMGDAIDDALGGEELEAEADAEVDQVLAELAIGTDALMGEVGASKLPSKAVANAAEVEQVEEEADDAGMDAMRARMQAL